MGARSLRRAAGAVFSFSLICSLLAGCGGYSSNQTQTPTSRITKRAFVSDSFDGSLHIEDAQNDVESASRITTGRQPGAMLLSPDRKTTLVFHAGENTLGIVDNTTESLTARIALPGASESFVLLSDNKTGFAAVRNSGVVVVFDTSSPTATSQIAVPLARRLVLSHNGNKLLVFSDESDTLTVIDTAAKTASAPIAGFSRPVWGVFSSDDSKAFILSCGPECAGAAPSASVTVLDMSTSTPGASVNVSAATIGLLDGSNLYVAGTQNGAGKLDVIDTGSLTATVSAVAISDGFHQRIALASNNRLFIGARTCTNLATLPNSGCLSIYNTSSKTAKVDNANGDVTGIQPISGRNVVYVIEGGELRIYDTTTDAQQTKQIDVVGQAVDVKEID